MTNEQELKEIKKLYGEKMSHLCRNLFPKILEYPGRLCELLPKLFHPSKFLYDDIIEQNKENAFQEYVLTKYYDAYTFDGLQKNKTEEMIEDPFTLISKAGYDLYECKTESDIQSFKKYYKKGEELCTFNGGRLDSCYVFFAVKKNVNEIKREDFKNPKRQDEYGTSVISIQFRRGTNNVISIKNRYNHTVPNCDATFSNDLENIIAGLTESFEKCYNLNLENAKTNGFELPGYVLASDGKFYKYNCEINNIYYCPDNNIIENHTIDNSFQEKEKYIVLDYFILDLQNKKIILYDQWINDSFINGLTDIEKIDVINNKENNTKTIKLKLTDGNIATIEIDNYNQIIGYENESIKTIGNSFLYFNTLLKQISLPNVEKIGYKFLFNNKILKEIDLPKVEVIDHDFMKIDRALEKINIPRVKIIGNRFLCNNELLKEIDLPNIEEVGDDFIHSNKKLEKINIPKVKIIGDRFLNSNQQLKEIDLPNVEKIAGKFIWCNETLEKINIPKVKIIGYCFLNSNQQLKEINLPNVEKIGDRFIWLNEILEKINIPKTKIIGSQFLSNNRALKEIVFPNVEEIGYDFMVENEVLKRINIPKIKITENYFLPKLTKAKKIIREQKIKNVVKSKVKNLLVVIKGKNNNRSKGL